MGWSSYPSPPRPYAPGPFPARARPGGAMGTVAVLLFLLALVLVAVSIAFPWYFLTGNSSAAGSSSYTVGFNLGNQISCSTTSTAGCTPLTYSSDGLNSTGSVYGAGFWLGVLELGLLSLVFVLGVLVFAGYARRRGLFRGLFALAVTSLLLLVALNLLITLATPGALRADTTSASGLLAPGPCGSSAPSPTQSFWGSCSSAATGISYSWGAGAGWYFALISIVLLVIAVLALASYRRRPVSQEEFSPSPPMPFPGAMAPSAPYALPAPGSEWSEGGPSGASLPPAYPTCPHCGLPLMDKPSRCPRCGLVLSQ